MTTIRAFRRARGWSHFDLATQVNVSSIAIRDWERGHMQPSTGQLHALADVFGVQVEQIKLAKAAGKSDRLGGRHTY